MKFKSQLAPLFFLLALNMVFSLDCFTPTAADSQAMQCCGSMPCNPGNSQHDCCKTMQKSPVAMIHTASGFLLASLTPVRHASFPVVFSLALVGSILPTTFTGSPGNIDHAPPFVSPQSIDVLRI